MLYELRRYECTPGQLKNLNELMEVLAVPVFKKVGMTFLGAWKPEVGDDENTLVYLLGHQDMGARERAWKAFYEDPGSPSVPSWPRSTAGRSSRAPTACSSRPPATRR